MSKTANWTVCQIVCWGLSAVAGIAVIWGTTGSVGIIGALMAGIAVAIFLGLVFTRLVCTDEAPVAGAVAGGAIGKLMGTEPAGAGTTAQQGSGNTAPKAEAVVPAAPKPKPEAAKPAPVAKAAAPATPTAAPAAAAAPETGSDKDGGDGEDVGTKPAALSAPKGGKADNLKEIKGVGPKLESLLHEMGFYHFDQIASWGKDELAWMDANLKGFKGRASRDNWVEQAKILAAGGETEFSKRVEDGGVY
jgi:predicted flap endonuclease-1-like 5' DNA nuclease